MGKVVTICDHLFLEHTKSASIGGGNIGVGPTHFEWEYADAQTARFVTGSDIKHARGEGQVAWLLEPYSLHPENYDLAFERRDEFDAILMHSHAGMHIAKWYPFGGSWIPFKKWGMYHKSRDVSILLSDKNTLEGHKLRHQVVKKFGNRVDVYKDIPDKLETLQEYRYSIIIESESAPHYFTEKLIDCMCVGTIPIYWGCPSIGRFFNGDGIITVNNLSDIEQALDMANERYYEEQRGAIGKNILLCRTYPVCENSIYAMYPELFNDD